MAIKRTATEAHSDEIHYIAEKFLEDYTATQAQTLTTERLEAADTQVVVLRDRIPEFYCGHKPSGRIVWSHDKRFAKYVNMPEADFLMNELTREGHSVRAEVQE